MLSNNQSSSKSINSNINSNNKKVMSMMDDQDENSKQFTPIGLIYPLMNSFKLKARVTMKGNIKEFNKKNGQKGYVFSADIMDWQGKSTTCQFYDKAAQKFHQLLEEGQVYEFEGGQVKLNTSKYNKNSEHLVTYEENSKIVLSQDDGTIKKNSFNFVSLDKIKDLQKDSFVDIIGIVSQNSQLQTITVKLNQEQKVKRTIQIHDQSRYNADIVLWEELAKKDDYVKGTIVVIKQGQIVEFNDTKTVKVTFQSAIYINPTDIAEANTLKRWKEENQNIELISLNLGHDILTDKSILINDLEEQSKRLQEQNQDKVYNTVKGLITFTKPDGTLFYLACGKGDCQKKVTYDENNQKYHCDSCGDHDKAKARWVTSVRITDSSGSIYGNIFDQVGNQLFEITAEEIRQLKDANQANLVQDKMKNCMYKEKAFKILTKLDNYQGDQKPRHQIIKVQDVDFNQENKDMLKTIEAYLAL